MKNTIILLLIAVIGSIMLLNVLDWYAFIPAAMMAGWVSQKNVFQTFWLVFASVFALFFLWSFVIDYFNEGILSRRIALLFGGIPSWLLLIITAMTGALPAGFAASSVASVKKLFFVKSEGQQNNTSK